MAAHQARGARLSGAAIALGASLVGCGGGGVHASKVQQPSSDSWCPEGFESGPNDTCFALPAQHGPETAVVLYFHDRLSGEGRPEQWALVRGLAEQGLAVVVPRGRRGLCAWSAAEANDFCWPEDASDAELQRTIVSSWERVLWQVDALLEEGKHPRFVVGHGQASSFVSAIVAQGGFRADGMALVSGRATSDAIASGVAPTPTLLAYVEGDGEQAQASQAMGKLLDRSGWAYAACPRPGAGELTSSDLDLAVKFFRRAARGELKRHKGLVPCAPAKGSEGRGQAPTDPPAQGHPAPKRGGAGEGAGGARARKA